MKFLFSGRVRFVALLAVALGGVAAISAEAAPPGANGQITFARSNPALGDTQAYVVNPDGTGERLIQGPTDTGEGPRWCRLGRRRILYRLHDIEAWAAARTFAHRADELSRASAA